jgi:hypothetical protein
MKHLARPDAVFLDGLKDAAQTQHYGKGECSQQKDSEKLTKYVPMEREKHKDDTFH